MEIPVLAQTDFYKTGHYIMYPPELAELFNNLTGRKSRFKEVNKVVVFGYQYFLKEYLINQWNRTFFNLPKEIAVGRYKRLMDFTLGKDSVEMKHIEELHDLQYLPIEVKALPEGSLCPIGVPLSVFKNTNFDAPWLVNYLETIYSCTVWQPITSATLAYELRKVLNHWALLTVGNTDFVQWQGHDFSMRGMSSLETACTSGAGHLLSFTGTDTVPAIVFLEDYYNANIEKELVGGSVPATEHSVMCCGTKDGEIQTFERLLDLFPKGILSVVSDTWSLPFVVTVILPALKEKIVTRGNGDFAKLVIRPDSFWTDPVDCLCGYDGWHPNMDTMNDAEIASIRKGLIESLWDIFGGTLTDKGYKLLDSHIGAIYGDSINIQRADEICKRLEKKGFASINCVLGVGSYTYQYNTRDSFGFAVKATHAKLLMTASEDMTSQGGPGIGGQYIENRDIFKAPITDDGTKKSAKGYVGVFKDDEDEFVLRDQLTEEEENSSENCLIPVFRNGALLVDSSLGEIRKRLGFITA